MSFAPTFVAVLLASSAAASVSTPLRGDPGVVHAQGLASKKGPPGAEPSPLLGTLADIHSGELVPLDADSPSESELDRLLADRVTGARGSLDPRLLGLLRSLARAHVGARIELVSGYRSPKLNEMLRKKGHHVASHSQHSLGHAVDFRIVEAGPLDPLIGPPLLAHAGPLDPLLLEREIRDLGWVGGTGVYLGKDDRFIHADVGPNRRWNGL